MSPLLAKKVIAMGKGSVNHTKIQCKINKKNKIIMSHFTIFDLVNMVLCAGGTPVFSDVEKKSITINLENIILPDANIS